ncbi:MAG: hypothetical protein AB1938_26030 [Myxococcota bacterium]
MWCVFAAGLVLASSPSPSAAAGSGLDAGAHESPDGAGGGKVALTTSTADAGMGGMAPQGFEAGRVGEPKLRETAEATSEAPLVPIEDAVNEPQAQTAEFAPAAPPPRPERGAPSAPLASPADAPLVASEAPPQVEDSAAGDELRPFAARWGVVGVMAAEYLSPLGQGGGTFRYRFGVGPRLALSPRRQGGEWVPTVGLVGGIVGSAQPSFFTELRLELLKAASLSLTQARFTAYVASGLEVRGGVEPYVGLGVGWNWLPTGESRGARVVKGAAAGAAGLLVLTGGILVGAGVAALVFAGRLELRYFPSTTAAGLRAPLAPFAPPPALAIMLGVGA